MNLWGFYVLDQHNVIPVKLAIYFILYKEIHVKTMCDVQLTSFPIGEMQHHISLWGLCFRSDVQVHTACRCNCIKVWCDKVWTKGTLLNIKACQFSFLLFFLCCNHMQFPLRKPQYNVLKFSGSNVTKMWKHLCSVLFEMRTFGTLERIKASH